MPRRTTSYTTAMKRLAEYLGVELESEGRRWVVVDGLDIPDDIGPMRGRNKTVLAHLLTIALAEGGRDMEPEAVRNVVNLDIRKDPKSGRLLLPENMTATEAAAISELYRE